MNEKHLITGVSKKMKLIKLINIFYQFLNSVFNKLTGWPSSHLGIYWHQDADAAYALLWAAPWFKVQGQRFFIMRRRLASSFFVRL